MFVIDSLLIKIALIGVIGIGAQWVAWRTGRPAIALMLIAGIIAGPVLGLIDPERDFGALREPVIKLAVAIILFGFTFPLFLGRHAGEPFAVVLTQSFLILGFLLMGITFGPMGALLPELFPTNVRYTGSAVAYNVSSILGAAVAPLIAVWLWQAADGSSWLVGIYLSSMAVLTLIALILIPETKDLAYEDDLGVATRG